MNISYKWLKEYVDFDLTPEEVCAALTSTGLEVDALEEVQTIKGGLKGLYIGQVLTCEPHPDSDHMHVCSVDLGKEEPSQIVCGAPNVAAGQKVIVADLGCVLYDGDKEFKIKKSKLRGVESNGMICAEDEIGIGTSHEGIIVLPEDAKVGTPAAEYYNLESDWDQNKKLKSLINWIKKWEADGVTKIDGIGSQMHISCYANAQTQESKKAAIENMFKLMAQSGKLIRISELDMGYVDAAGNSVSTNNMTEEQHKQMAELYTFVVSKYLEIIPAAQQWGICQWCITDSPKDSGWRKGEPTGLWDKDYYRKHTYAGFANGLLGN